jgi:hypothetical protein
MINGRRTDRGLGGYPQMSLEEARHRAQQYRDQIELGVDPAELEEPPRSVPNLDPNAR